MAAVQRKLVHKQFNSPMGLYSQQNVKETLDRELKAFGSDGIEVDDQISKPLNLANSAVLRAVEEEEQMKCGYKRVAWPPASEERIIREFTPQPQSQTPPTGGQPYYQQHQPQHQQQQPQQHQPASVAAAVPAAQGPIYNNVAARQNSPYPNQYQQHPPQQQQQQPPQQNYQQQPQQQYQPPQQQQPPQQPVQYSQAQFDRQAPAASAPYQQPPQQYQQQQYQQQPPQPQQQHIPYQPAAQEAPLSPSGWKPIRPPVTKPQNQYSPQYQSTEPSYPAAAQQQYQQQPQYRAPSYDRYQQPSGQPQYQAPQYNNYQQPQQPQQQYQQPPSQYQPPPQQQLPQQPAWAHQQQPPQQLPPQAAWAHQQQPPQQQQQQPQYQQPQYQQPQQQQQQQQQYQAPTNYQSQAPPPQNQQHQPQQQQPQYQVDPQANLYNSYSQPHQSAPHSQDQTDYQQALPQDYRGASPGIITLRKETPVTQKPAPVYTSQPAAVSYQDDYSAGGSNMRGDLKWPPPEYKEAAARENEERRALALGPVCRPRRINRDYSSFFAKHALNNAYPAYKVPPGTQHMLA